MPGRIEIARAVRIVLAVLLVGLAAPVAAEYEFEQGKFRAGEVCAEMVGTWYTDVTVQTEKDGKKRDVTKLVRKADGSAYLRGLSVFYDTQGVSYWDFPSQWSCDGDWYVEANEWGYTAFRIISLGYAENVLLDERNNLGAAQPIELIEKRTLSSASDLLQIPEVEAHFNSTPQE